MFELAMVNEQSVFELLRFDSMRSCGKHLRYWQPEVKKTTIEKYTSSKTNKQTKRDLKNDRGGSNEYPQAMF